MQSIRKVFHNNLKRSYTREQKEQIQQLFLNNTILNTLYEEKCFDELLSILNYAIIEADDCLQLIHTKRSELVVLLAGQIEIHKKSLEQSSQGKINKALSMQKKHKQKGVDFYLAGIYNQLNQTVTLNSECKVYSKNGNTAQVFFITVQDYNAYISKRKQQKIQMKSQIIKYFYPEASKNNINQISSAEWVFKQFRINNYIYRHTDIPDYAYFLLEGSVRLQNPTFSLQSSSPSVIIHAKKIFGQKDIAQSTRQQSVICCSAFSSVFMVPKNAFIKFARIYSPELFYNFPQPKQIKGITNKRLLMPLRSGNTDAIRQLRRSTSRKKIKQTILPKLQMYHNQSVKQQHKNYDEEYRLIKNSHILLQSKPHKRNRQIRSHSSIQSSIKDSIHERLKSFNKKQPSPIKLDLSNRLF